MGNNEIIEDNGSWLLIDISTIKFLNATMAVDTDVFNAHNGGRIHAVSSKTDKYIYARYKKNGELIHFHRNVIQIKKGFEVDHVIHGSMLFIDNRGSNLRLVTASQNSINRSMPLRNTSGVKGVSWYKRYNKWIVHISINGKSKNLGYFDTIIDAVAERMRAEREYYGEYAYSN
jgi:hypothetical protein